MKYIIVFIFSLVWTRTNCQQITYSQADPEDISDMSFNIIGKISGNFLIFKNTKNRATIGVYDNNMKIIENAGPYFMPNQILSLDFIVYSDFAYIIYQFQENKIFHCMAASINGHGKLIKQPFNLDTTFMDSFSDNRIYGVISSEDKSKIMIYKIKRENDSLNFTTTLFNDSLQLIHKSIIETPYDEDQQVFSDFLVDNKGSFVFTERGMPNSRDNVQKLTLVTKGPFQDNLSFHDINNITGNYLEETKLKIDNKNSQYLINSLFYSKKNLNVDGLYTAVWNIKSDSLVAQNFNQFSDQLKITAKSSSSKRSAFNDYFINDVILRKDGGFVLIAEENEIKSYSRFEFFIRGNNSFSGQNNYYLNSSASHFYSHNYIYYGEGGHLRYFYNNIAVLEVDNTGKLAWSDVIQKSQSHDNSDNYLSFGTMVSDEKIDFLFNYSKRRTLLPEEQSISVDGRLTANVHIRNLDHIYDFMPRYAKQVNSYELIMPCMRKNVICFAKIEY